MAIYIDNLTELVTVSVQCFLKAPCRGLWVPWAGSLWHKRAGVATPWSQPIRAQYLDQWEWTSLLEMPDRTVPAVVRSEELGWPHTSHPFLCPAACYEESWKNKFNACFFCWNNKSLDKSRLFDQPWMHVSFSRRVVRFRKVLKMPLKKTITALKRPKVEFHLKSGKGTFKKLKL